jgi:hypothetical protein
VTHEPASSRRSRRHEILADIVAVDAEDQPLLVAEVKTHRAGPEAWEQVRAEMEAYGVDAGFVVDLENVYLVQTGRDPESVLPTADLLRP